MFVYMFVLITKGQYLIPRNMDNKGTENLKFKFSLEVNLDTLKWKVKYVL